MIIFSSYKKINALPLGLGLSELCEIHHKLRYMEWDDRLGKKPLFWNIRLPVFLEGLGNWLSDIPYYKWLYFVDRQIGWIIAHKWEWNMLSIDSHALNDKIMEWAEGED